MDDLQRAIERIEQNIGKGVEDTKDYDCAKCKDTGFIIENRNGYDYAIRCDCYERKLSKILMNRSGVSEEDQKKGFTDFNTLNEPALISAKNTAIKYLTAFNAIKGERVNSLLLSGASGRGKTTLGLAVANNLIKIGVGVRYMPYRDEVIALKQEITDEYTYTQHIHRLKTAPVLFIDDLLKGKVTDSDVNILYEIINTRYISRLPLIISTEKTAAELLSFDEAIGSRILEISKGYTVTLDKSIPNYRMR